MPDKEREKLEFATNIPVDVVLGKNFKSGTGKWGAWHGWNMIHDGSEKVVFAKDALHDKIKDYPEGAKLTIRYAEKKGDSGLYHEWEVSNGSKPVSNGHKPELTREVLTVDFSLESHLLACAGVANLIIDKLGLTEDSARQACFATVCIDAQRHNVILSDSKPSEATDDRKEALLKGVRGACKLLNDEGYDPPFTQKLLDEYVNEKFETEQGVKGLSVADTEDLIQMLSEKLDNFRLNKSIGDEPVEEPPF